MCAPRCPQADDIILTEEEALRCAEDYGLPTKGADESSDDFLLRIFAWVTAKSKELRESNPSDKEEVTRDDKEIRTSCAPTPVELTAHCARPIHHPARPLRCIG